MWTETHEKSYKDVKRALLDSVCLAHLDPDPTLAVCVFADSSDAGWGGIVTLCPEKDLEKTDPATFDHRVIGMVSGVHKGPSRNWSMVCREAAALIYTIHGQKI